jgi:predicted mannosyl-3-phosphoglycerate phosphatase (HAD superfamily)
MCVTPTVTRPTLSVMDVLDVDGTLLNSAQQLTLRTEEAIRAARDVGVPMVVATGKVTLGSWLYVAHNCLRLVSL